MIHLSIPPRQHRKTPERPVLELARYVRPVDVCEAYAKAGQMHVFQTPFGPVTIIEDPAMPPDAFEIRSVDVKLLPSRIVVKGID